MSISDFNAVIQSKIYKQWLEKLSGKNIVNTGTKALRSSQQVAEKTDFYITAKDLELMYQTITGTSLAEAKINVNDLLESLRIGTADPTVKNAVVGKSITVGDVRGLFFSKIGFDTITTRLNSVFDDLPGVIEAYKAAEKKFAEEELKQLKNDPKYKSSKPNEKQRMEDKVLSRAKERASLGFYFNKGHVIGVATNLTKQFKDDLEKAYDEAIAAGDQRALAVKKDILAVLDEYIKRLEQDDLATANLAKSSINTELYAQYVKTSSRYLVEMQLRIGNQIAGRDVAPIINELTSIFSGSLSQQEFTKILENSPELGKTLIISPGSPSMLSLITTDIVNAISGKLVNNKSYSIPLTKVASNKINIVSTKKSDNKKKIAKLNNLKQKIKSVQKKQPIIKPDTSERIFSGLTNLTSLQNLLNANLVDQVKRNMGNGTRSDVLNLQTGRFAESVEVTRLSESRQGMITAFYTYMKNPYATFSAGGRQEFPTSRDPKTLISRSIREIAAEQVSNRLRSVLV
jgi:hypothetical protein